MRREVFEQFGRFDERYRVAFNDVDLCLRMRQAGYAVVYQPHAVLYHHESRTRGSDVVPDKLSRFAAEAALIKQEWGHVLGVADPYYSPHLTTEAVRSFELRLDSPAADSFQALRAAAPWRVVAPKSPRT